MTAASLYLGSTEAEFAAMVNASADAEAVAYPIPEIKRTEGVFPSEFQDERQPLKIQCQVNFTNVPGLVWTRLVPGIGEWTLVDLLKRNMQDFFCVRCSTCEKKDICEPISYTLVQHKADACPFAAKAAQKDRNAALIYPDETRIGG
jgi:hypothetical protein